MRREEGFALLLMEMEFTYFISTSIMHMLPVINDSICNKGSKICILQQQRKGNLDESQ